MQRDEFIVGHDDRILVTGATGFIGRRLVSSLLDLGYANLRCISRGNSDSTTFSELVQTSDRSVTLEFVKGDLLSPRDCAKIVEGVSLIYHLAAGRGEKAYSDAFMNSVVTTRNLLEAARQSASLRRVVNISSFSVYSNDQNRASRIMDETFAMESRPALRGDAYTFAKVKQDELVFDYGKRYGLPYVIVRPGYVYGPGNEGITGRVGLGTFGVFLHLGGSNTLPLTYVDNCAHAIALAGLKPAIEGEIFNIVDDDLPSSRRFLRLYKKNVRPFRSIYLPPAASYLFCLLWEKYSEWSEGQLPPTFNRRIWHAYWKSTKYSNKRAKERLGWAPKIPTSEGLSRYFASCKQKALSA